jgi:hypothetical protein
MPVKQVWTPSYIKKVITKHYGNVPKISFRDPIGAGLLQAANEVDGMQLELQISTRMPRMGQTMYGGVFTFFYYTNLVAWVEGSRASGSSIESALNSFMEYYGISIEDISMETLRKQYERWREVR